MDNGQVGVHGTHAAKHVEEELRQDAEDVIRPHHLEVVKTVLEKLQIQNIAAQRRARPVGINKFYA